MVGNQFIIVLEDGEKTAVEKKCGQHYYHRIKIALTCQVSNYMVLLLPPKEAERQSITKGEKKSKRTNALFLTDKVGLPLAISNPVGGDHKYLFEIEKAFLKILSDLSLSGIDSNGLFMNADPGFDSEGFRRICFTNDIIANMDVNKRNSKNIDNQSLLDDQLYKNDFLLKE